MVTVLLRFLVTFVLAVVAVNARAGQWVHWEGLCVPQKYVTAIQQPGGEPQFRGPFGEALRHLESSGAPVSVTPTLGVELSGKELAKAIPGYVAGVTSKLPGGSPIHLYFGSVVAIVPASESVTPIDSAMKLENLWDMTAEWTGSDVSPLNGSSFYKVRRKGDPLNMADMSWTLVRINLLSKGPRNMPFSPVSNWYIGTCVVLNAHAPAMGFRCERRMLITKGFRVNYSVNAQNINLLGKIDKFMGAKIDDWKANCGKQDQ